MAASRTLLLAELEELLPSICKIVAGTRFRLIDAAKIINRCSHNGEGNNRTIKAAVHSYVLEKDATEAIGDRSRTIVSFITIQFSEWLLFMSTSP